MTNADGFAYVNSLSRNHGFLDAKKIPAKERTLRRKPEQRAPASTSSHHPPVCFCEQPFVEESETASHTSGLSNHPAVSPLLPTDRSGGGRISSEGCQETFRR